MDIENQNSRVAGDFLPRRLAQRADNGEDMSGLDMRGSRLAGVDFRGARLAGSNFCHCDLRGARFDFADLRGSHFWNSDLTDVRFDGSDLTGADLDFSTLDGAVFLGARLKRTDLPDNCVTIEQIRRSVKFGEAIPRGAEKRGRRYA